MCIHSMSCMFASILNIDMSKMITIGGEVFTWYDVKVFVGKIMMLESLLYYCDAEVFAGDNIMEVFTNDDVMLRYYQ